MEDEIDTNFPYEEFSVLTGATIPGTARHIHQRTAVCKSPLDVAAADLMYDARPSGIVLPKILRRKLRLLNKLKRIDSDSVVDDAKVPDNSSDAINKKIQQTSRALRGMAYVPLYDRVAHFDAKRLHSKSPIAQTQSYFEQAVENDKDDIKAHIPENYETPTTYMHIDRSRVFRCTDLERKLSKANAALIEIQKQIMRGEEIYFQDTDAHGNIYKGWESFIDSKPEQLGILDVDSILSDECSLLGPTTASSAPSRKLHADLRWFSSSSFTVEQGIIRKVDRRKKAASLTPVPTRNTSPKPSRSPVASTLDCRMEEIPNETTSNIETMKDNVSLSPSTPNVSVNVEEDKSPKLSTNSDMMENDDKVFSENMETENIDKTLSISNESPVKEESVSNSPLDMDDQKEQVEPEDISAVKESDLAPNAESNAENIGDFSKSEFDSPTSEHKEDAENEAKPEKNDNGDMQESKAEKRKHEDVEESPEENISGEDAEKSTDVRGSSRLRKRLKH